MILILVAGAVCGRSIIENSKKLQEEIDQGGKNKDQNDFYQYPPTHVYQNHHQIHPQFSKNVIIMHF